jgi:hypothetical protein
MVVLGAGGAACSSSSASPVVATGDGGARDSATKDAAAPPKDAAADVRARDAAVDSTDATATADGKVDAAEGSGGTPGCYTLTGSGSSRQCVVTVPASSAGCSGGTTAGACPSTNLYGCCVITSADAGADAFTATCYYSSAVGSPAESNCEDEAYESIPAAWDTMSP